MLSWQKLIGCCYYNHIIKSCVSASVLVQMIRGGSIGHLELVTRKWIASSVSLWSQRECVGVIQVGWLHLHINGFIISVGVGERTAKRVE